MLLPVQPCGKGVNLDLLPSELGAEVWSDVSNVRSHNGFTERRKGFVAAYTTPTSTPYWIGTFNTSTARFLIQLGTATGFCDDGTTRTNISPGVAPTGARDDRWGGFDFNGVFICNNGVDNPYYWNGNTATDLAALTNWPSGYKADALCMFKEYIFAIAITKAGTKYPYRVLWSNAAEPGSLPTSYTAAATNDAGEKDIPGIGILVDALPYADMLIVYGQEGRYALRYIGGEFIFNSQQLPGKDGVLTRGCVVNTPKGHVFLTNGDVRIHTGGESQSLAEGVVKKWLQATMDTTNAARSFVCLNPQQTEVWVCFPATGSTDCDTVLAWNWENNTWAKFTAPNLTYGTAGLVSSSLAAATWAAQTATWANISSVWSQNEASSNESRLIVATSTPTIGLANVGSLDFSTSVTWYAEKIGIPLSEGADLVRSISKVRLRADAVAGTAVTVKTSTTMTADETPTYSGSATHTQGTSNFTDNFSKGGRYGAVRFEGADDQQLAMRSYQIEVPDTRARF